MSCRVILLVEPSKYCQVRAYFQTLELDVHEGRLHLMGGFRSSLQAAKFRG